MTTRLAVWNQALQEFLGETRLASETEARQARYELEDAWEPAVSYCLEQGLWKFATRAVMLDYTPSVEPEFGYQRAFPIPDDHIRTIGVWRDEFHKHPLREYREESGGDGSVWVADVETLYVTYVSDDEAFGYDLTKWPESFARFVAADLAVRVAMVLTGSRSKMEDCVALRKKYGQGALSKDAMANPSRELPHGSWVASRHGRAGRPSREDG